MQLGFKTILVLSDGARRKDLSRFAYGPDMIVESISKLSHDDLVREFVTMNEPSPAP